MGSNARFISGVRSHTSKLSIYFFKGGNIMIKNTIIIILCFVIMGLILKNHIDRYNDRLIQRIEFQKILDDIQPQIKFPKKIYL